MTKTPLQPSYITNDKKYAIRRKLGISSIWIAYPLGEPETDQNTKCGSVNECLQYLIDQKHYRKEQILLLNNG